MYITAGMTPTRTEIQDSLDRCDELIKVLDKMAKRTQSPRILGITENVRAIRRAIKDELKSPD